MRILYVAMTSWGVGDELALRGTYSLLERVFPDHVKLFAEKNPELRPLPNAVFTSDVWQEQVCDFLPDLIVHAGGNEWAGDLHSVWDSLSITAGVPVVYLGVGMHNAAADQERSAKVLAHCPLFIGRDHVAVAHAEALGARHAMRLCCPSIFIGRTSQNGGPLGLVYEARNAAMAHNCGSDALHEAEVDVFCRASAAGPTRIICHFIGDYAEALKRFPKWHDRIVYSRVLDDYLRWYSTCSKIASMRLHGAHLGVGCDKPTLCLRTGVGKTCALGGIGVPLVHPSSAVFADAGMFSNPTQTTALKAESLEKYMCALRELKAELLADMGNGGGA
jgi:hypothetical protein